jgi:hypothetical protein
LRTRIPHRAGSAIHGSQAPGLGWVRPERARIAPASDANTLCQTRCHDTCARMGMTQPNPSHRLLPHHRLVAYNVSLELLVCVRNAAIKDPPASRERGLRSLSATRHFAQRRAFVSTPRRPPGAQAPQTKRASSVSLEARYLKWQRRLRSPHLLGTVKPRTLNSHAPSQIGSTRFLQASHAEPCTRSLPAIPEPLGCRGSSVRVREMGLAIKTGLGACRPAIGAAS